MILLLLGYLVYWFVFGNLYVPFVFLLKELVNRMDLSFFLFSMKWIKLQYAFYAHLIILPILLLLLFKDEVLYLTN